MAAFGGGLGFLKVRRVPGTPDRRSGERWATESGGWRGPCLPWSTGREQPSAKARLPGRAGPAHGGQQPRAWRGWPSCALRRAALRLARPVRLRSGRSKQDARAVTAGRQAPNQAAQCTAQAPACFFGVGVPKKTSRAPLSPPLPRHVRTPPTRRTCARPGASSSPTAIFHIVSYFHIISIHTV